MKGCVSKFFTLKQKDTQIRGTDYVCLNLKKNVSNSNEGKFLKNNDLKCAILKLTSPSRTTKLLDYPNWFLICFVKSNLIGFKCYRNKKN